MSVVSKTAVSDAVSAVSAKTVSVSAVSAVRDLVGVADSGGAVVTAMTVACKKHFMKNSCFDSD